MGNNSQSRWRAAYPVGKQIVQNAFESRMYPCRKLALYSDQDFPANEELDARLLRLIGRPQPKIGYIPAASDPERIYFRRKADYYAGIGADLVVYVDPGQDTSETEWSTLLSCDAIHLSGGNTFSFLSWLQRRNALPLLTRYVSEGGVLIGVSAGAILMTPSVNSARLCGDTRDERLMDNAGLGLVDFHIWPHFDSAIVTRDQSKWLDNAAAVNLEIGAMNKTREFLLPFGINLRVEDGIANIESDLPAALPSFSDPVENGRMVGVVEGVEQLLLSLARAGIDLSNPQFAQAISDCIANLQSG